MRTAQMVTICNNEPPATMPGRSGCARPDHAASGPQAAGQIKPQLFQAPPWLRKGPGHGRARPIKRQFSHCHKWCHLVMGQPAHRHQQAQRNWQVVMAALLRQVGGRKIMVMRSYGSASPIADSCRTHAFAAFGHGFIRQANHCKALWPGARCT